MKLLLRLSPSSFSHPSLFRLFCRQVYLWNRPLGAYQRNVMVDGFDQKMVFGLLAFYRMEEGRGHIVTEGLQDFLNNDGVLVGAPEWIQDAPMKVRRVRFFLRHDNVDGWLLSLGGPRSSFGSRDNRSPLDCMLFKVWPAELSLPPTAFSNRAHGGHWA